MFASEIKNVLKQKLNSNEFKFDQLKQQKFIEIRNASFIVDTPNIVIHNHHVTDPQWYVDNYEPLMMDKLDGIVNKIKEDPDTRKAYIAMLDPDKYYNGEEICTIGMHVIYNKFNKTVSYIVYMRSNNVCEYTQDSIWQFKIFNKIIGKLQKNVDKDIRPGYMYWNAGSLHMYEEDFKFLSDN